MLTMLNAALGAALLRAPATLDPGRLRPPPEPADPAKRRLMAIVDLGGRRPWADD